MRRRAFIAGAAALPLAAALGHGAHAVEIRRGATMEVKANSIWYEDADKLARWQELKKSGKSAAFKSYQKETMRRREAWQFINQTTVTILGYEPATNQVKVEMQTTGRMQGSKWFVDADALMR